MAHMLRSKEETEAAGIPAKAEGPEYPYGLRLQLTEAELKKLDMGHLPKVGEEFAIEARAHVVSVRAEDHAGAPEPSHHVELQLTHMHMESPEEDDDDGDEPGKSLYK